MRTSFRHQSEAQPPNGPLTAATSLDTPSTCPATQSVSRKCAARQLIPVLLGNTVGGTALFALISYAQVMKEI